MIYIIRHGQTDLNLQMRAQGRKGYPLNQTGIQQAQQLCDKLKNVKFDYVFSSPQERALQTARIASGKEPIKDARIDCYDIGTADTLELNQIVFNGKIPDSKIYQGVEELESYVSRIFDFMKELETKFKGKDLNILISGHKDTTSCMIAYFKGMPKDLNFFKYSLENGGMSIHSFEDVK